MALVVHRGGRVEEEWVGPGMRQPQNRPERFHAFAADRFFFPALATFSKNTQPLWSLMDGECSL